MVKTIVSDTSLPLEARFAPLVELVPGWTPLDQLCALYTLALASSHLDGDLVEIGSWCGRSTIVLAQAAWESGGMVHAVDFFPAADDWTTNSDGTHSFTVIIDGVRRGSYHVQTVWDEPFQRDIAPLYREEPSLLTRFTRNLEAFGVRDRVVVHRGNSAMFGRAAADGLRCRLMFVDGDHSREAVVEDIGVAERFLLPGGWLCFDDAFTVYAGIDAAIRERVIGSGGYELGHRATRKMFAARRIGKPGR